MLNFENTHLFRESFGEVGSRKKKGPFQRHQDRLRNAFLRLRENVNGLSSSIVADHPGFTVHDIRHADSLWETASLLLGEETFLNPLETFVLGCTFLTHDLGMALQSYPNGIPDLKSQVLWHDMASRHFASLHGRIPGTSELAAFEVNYEKTIAADMLRREHAKQAARLLRLEYRKDAESPPFFLLEDQELRNSLSHTIGQIASSHWWPISELYGNTLDQQGSFGTFPGEWQIDSKRIACVLRCADACSIDSQRAPCLERALSRPFGVSDLHWGFQEKLSKPIPRGNRIEFQSSTPFAVTETDQWWLAYDAIRLANRELNDSDELLCTTNRQPLQIRGVVGCATATELAKRVKTIGWSPVDCAIRVTDAPTIISKLGGEMLYGHDPTIPLREMIQNARDAIIARRHIETDRPRDFGEIRVSVKRKDNRYTTISISDNGIGMSDKVLGGPLIDFGRSYWSSELCLEEHPGLVGSRFAPNGQFGIGFFSVFMWGDNVKVASRSIKASKEQTHVLHFNGINSRPILRLAEASEQLNDPGTLITVEATRNIGKDGSYFAPSFDRPPFLLGSHPVDWSLSNTVQWLCPAMDVDVTTIEGNANPVFYRANSWTGAHAAESIPKVFRESGISRALLEHDAVKWLSSNITTCYDDDERPFLRGAICPFQYLNVEAPHGAELHPDLRMLDLQLPLQLGHFTAGCFRGMDMGPLPFFGIWLGTPSTADRRHSLGIIPSTKRMVEWASNQAIKVATAPKCAFAIKEKMYRGANDSICFADGDLLRWITEVEWHGGQGQAAGFLAALGADIGPIEVARTSKGFVSPNVIAATTLPARIVICEDVLWASQNAIALRDYLLNDDVIAIHLHEMETFAPRLPTRCDFEGASDHPWWKRCWRSVSAHVVRAVAKSWGSSLDDVLASAIFGIKNEDARNVPVGTRGGKQWLSIRMSILNRPSR